MAWDVGRAIVDVTRVVSRAGTRRGESLCVTALNFLRDDAAEKFERVGSELLRDPWAARNDYIDVILDPDHARADFLQRHANLRQKSRAFGICWKCNEARC